MKKGKQHLFSITIQCTSTKEIEQNKVFLFQADYNRMLKRIDEIVHVDENNNEWSLIKIEKL